MQILQAVRLTGKAQQAPVKFLGNKLVSWFSKKQNSVSTSTAEAEYIAAGSCCAQILWMMNQLFRLWLISKQHSYFL